MATRVVARVVQSTPTSDGAGVRLRRAIGTHLLPQVDPFLMLDEFYSDDPNDYLAGFPDHPHRGFETVTYMLAGAMEHHDSVGNRGRLVGGGAQWMTAGRGIIHSEMPKQESGLMWGFQLWVNLPAKDKMVKPRYQDLVPESIPTVDLPGASVRVVAGEVDGVRGPVEGIVTSPTFLDVRLKKGGTFTQRVPATHGAFVYPYKGTIKIGDSTIERGSTAVLSEGDEITLSSDEESAAIVLAGAPLKEPIARHGPFVMNTAAEIQQAVRDYQLGKLTQ
ncbi:MAG: pirin family protein [Polyangiales bacterium]